MSSHSSSRRGLWCVLCAGILWGTIGIVSHVLFGLSQTTPFSVSFFRFAFAFPILLGRFFRVDNILAMNTACIMMSVERNTEVVE